MSRLVPSILFSLCLISPAFAAAADKTVTPTHSIFAGLKVYPNPWRSDTHANTGVTFSPLPTGSTVKLYTTSGHFVKTLPSGTNSWDLKNNKGESVASGVYLYVVTLQNSPDKAQGKVVVIK